MERSCGARSPEHVDIGLHQTKVDPDRVDVENIAQHPVGDGVANRGDGGRVAEGVVDHQHSIGLLSRGDHPLGGFDGVGQRLFDQHVLAGL